MNPFALIPMRWKDRLKPLLWSRRRNVSQAGQDFWVYGEAFNEMRNGYFVDIGAADGVYLSNTLLLERRYGWHGICVEANPEVFERLRRRRRCTCLNLCLDQEEGVVEFAMDGLFGGIVSGDIGKTPGHVGERAGVAVIRLKTLPLEAVLDRHGAPKEIDYLSMDVEGAEERILRCFDFGKYLFRCVTIERPTEVLRDLFTRQGYLVIKELPGLDVMYIHKSFLDAFNLNMMRFWNHQGPENSRREERV